MYLHWAHYPSAKKYEHDICLGDVPKEVLDDYLGNESKNEIFAEEFPFHYSPELDRVVFQG